MTRTITPRSSQFVTDILLLLWFQSNQKLSPPSGLIGIYIHSLLFQGQFTLPVLLNAMIYFSRLLRKQPIRRRDSVMNIERTSWMGETEDDVLHLNLNQDGLQEGDQVSLYATFVCCLLLAQKFGMDQPYDMKWWNDHSKVTEINSLQWVVFTRLDGRLLVREAEYSVWSNALKSLAESEQRISSPTSDF